MPAESEPRSNTNRRVNSTIPRNSELEPYHKMQLCVILMTVVECSPMARETGVQSQVESYQRLKKWYLMSPWLTLSIIRYISRVKWSNPGKGVAPSPTPWCSSYWKGSFRVILDSRSPTLLLLLLLGRGCSRYIPNPADRLNIE